MDYVIHPYTMGTLLDLNSFISDYGPGFNSKCFIGFYKFNWKWGYIWKYIFTLTAASNYSTYT